MNTDIRVDVGFLDHWKTETLINECGVEAVLSLLRIWVFAAQNKPSGKLDGIKLTTIERIGKWRGEAGRLTNCLVDLRLIEQDSSGDWCLHDWEAHNPYAAKAEWRKQRGRKGAEARWKEKGWAGEEKKEDATSMLQVCSSDAPAPAPAPIAGLPKGNPYCRAEDEKPARRSPTAPVRQVIKHLNERAGKSFKPNVKPTIQHITARIKEGFTLEDFMTVIDFKTDEWGTDPKMMEFIRPQTLFGTKFESYLEAAKAAGYGPHLHVEGGSLPDLDELKKQKEAEEHVQVSAGNPNELHPRGTDRSPQHDHPG